MTNKLAEKRELLELIVDGAVLMNKLEERRADLERKILAIFHAVHDMPETCEKGIGKYSIKRTLTLHDETLKVSINTIKRVVDKMLEDGVIECVNPRYKCGLRFRFRLVGGCDDL